MDTSIYRREGDRAMISDFATAAPSFYDAAVLELEVNTARVGELNSNPRVPER